MGKKAIIVKHNHETPALTILVQFVGFAIRRSLSAFRRRTNTYAKSVSGLQRVLNIFWMFHNFIRCHFTTRQVPAVALGILQKGLTWEELLQLRVLC